MVAAVNATIERAVALGHLRDRLDKPYTCYMPDKGQDSQRYPLLIDARCTIHRYMAAYVASEVPRIPQEDIDASVAGRHPTVLVVGPRQFVRPVYNYLHDGPYPQAKLRVSEPLAVNPFDGYVRLARNPRSNLGWRILIYCDRFEGWAEAVRDALTSGDELVTTVPSVWRDERLGTAALLERALNGSAMDDGEAGRLAARMGLTIAQLRSLIAAGEAEEEDGAPTSAEQDQATDAAGPAQPTILCTTLKGAKGLSAQHGSSSA